MLINIAASEAISMRAVANSSAAAPVFTVFTAAAGPAQYLQLDRWAAGA